MFVRDSCSKQLDSDRLAADVPQFSSRPSLVPSVTVVLLKFSDRWERGEEEEEEEEDLFVFNDTIEGPRAPAVKPGRVTQA